MAASAVEMAAAVARRDFQYMITGLCKKTVVLFDDHLWLNLGTKIDGTRFFYYQKRPVRKEKEGEMGRKREKAEKPGDISECDHYLLTHNTSPLPIVYSWLLGLQRENNIHNCGN